jgi:aminoglycoside/choline kinase family phosphotransferase
MYPGISYATRLRVNTRVCCVPERLEKLKHWLASELDFSEYTLSPASADASFRRYFRVTRDGESFIVMDAPPDREDSRPFVRVSKMFFDIGLNVPEVIDENLEQGFLLLSDLGSSPYLDALNDESVERLYGDALGALATIQACVPDDGALPAYDRTLLLNEMSLFREWLVGKHLGINLSDAQSGMLEAVFSLLADNALAQPQVCVHRDYHSRNLMVTGRNNPGILDFQDAVVGPVTYDLVSLLRDCYIAWPRAQVEDWALGYRDLALQSGVLREEHEDPVRFLRWFDLMGVQRHLKAAGIFARLNHRDGKPGYLGDIPRTLGYVLEVAKRYDELTEFGKFVDEDVMSLICQQSAGLPGENNRRIEGVPDG